MIKKLKWITNEYDHRIACVGNLLISYIFKPWLSRRYTVQIGLSTNFDVYELNYINKKFKTEEEAVLYVEAWWNTVVIRMTNARDSEKIKGSKEN